MICVPDTAVAERPVGFGRRLRVRRRRVLDRRVAAQVAGRVSGADAVAVGRRRRESGVVVGGGRRGRDLYERRAGRALAALDPVVRDCDIVRRPVQARLIWLPETAVALSPVGAVGACVSGVVAFWIAV